MPTESGDKVITSIPFQLLSWQPRILYFPKFATAEQCEGIIDMTKPSLEPSRLALRQGESHDTTKDIRTSSSEDKMGVLEVVEEKIARATMIPRNHGEVEFLCFFFVTVVVVHSYIEVVSH